MLLAKRRGALGLQLGLELAVLPLHRLDGLEQLVQLGRQLGDAGGRHGGQGAEDRLVVLAGPERPAAAQEIDPGLVAEPLGAHDGDDAHLAGAGHVGAAAGGAVEVGHADHPDLPLAARGLAQVQGDGCGGVVVGNVHRPVFPDDGVGQAESLGHLAVVEPVGGQVDGADIRTHVEAHGAQPVEPHERLRQDVLSRVLLHVVEPAVRVHPAPHPRRIRRMRQQVVDVASVILAHLEHRLARQGAGVGRLAARARVERRLVEIDPDAASRRLAPEHAGFEFTLGGILVIQPFGHGALRRR